MASACPRLVSTFRGGVLLDIFGRSAAVSRRGLCGVLRPAECTGRYLDELQILSVAELIPRPAWVRASRGTQMMVPEWRAYSQEALRQVAFQLAITPRLVDPHYHPDAQRAVTIRLGGLDGVEAVALGLAERAGPAATQK